MNSFLKDFEFPAIFSQLFFQDICIIGSTTVGLGNPSNGGIVVGGGKICLNAGTLLEILIDKCKFQHIYFQRKK